MQSSDYGRMLTDWFLFSRANEGSILAVQVFDQKKFKKKDQGFLGVINIRIGDVLPDLGPDADGKWTVRSRLPLTFC